MTKIQLACRVDIGVRESNDDRALIHGRILNMEGCGGETGLPAAAIVCDGCGGYAGGGAAAETVLSVLRGEEDVNVARRRLPLALIRRALAIVVFYSLILLSATVALSLIEGDRYDLTDLLFEATSALATVGVSSVGTPNLKPASHFVLAPLMFIGRVGPLTMALALAQWQGRSKTKLRYPEETITIG